MSRYPYQPTNWDCHIHRSGGTIPPATEDLRIYCHPWGDHPAGPDTSGTRRNQADAVRLLVFMYRRLPSDMLERLAPMLARALDDAGYVDNLVRQHLESLVPMCSTCNTRTDCLECHVCPGPAAQTPEFREEDCGGTFDGFTCGTDADPGL